VRGVGRTTLASQADRPVASMLQRYVTQNDDARIKRIAKRPAGLTAIDSA
jgi:hypothetical protein